LWSWPATSISASRTQRALPGQISSECGKSKNPIATIRKSHHWCDNCRGATISPSWDNGNAQNRSSGVLGERARHDGRHLGPTVDQLVVARNGPGPKI
jgi:hypothetical protein